MSLRSAAGLSANELAPLRQLNHHSPSVNWFDSGPIPKTATLMPWATSFFTAQAPMPAEPPVTTATSFGQSQPLWSLLQAHLLSAHELSIPFASKSAQAPKPLLIRWTMVAWRRPKSRLSGMPNVEGSVKCKPMHVAIKAKHRSIFEEQG